MADLPVNIVVKLLNEATAPMRKMKEDFKSVETALKKASEVFDLPMKINQASEAMSRFAAKLNAVTEKPVELASNMQTALVMLQQGAGITDQALSDVQATLGDMITGGEFDMTQAANGLSLLTKQLNIGTTPALEQYSKFMTFADANNLDLTQSVDMVTTVMKGYGASVDEAGKYTDVLTKMFIATGKPTTDLAPALAQVGQLTKQFGGNFDESAGMLMAFVRATGNVGESAGVLQGVFQKMTGKGGARQAAIALDTIRQKTGKTLELFDQKGKLKGGLAESISKVFQATEGKIGGAKQARIFEMIFGSGALPEMMRKLGPEGLGKAMALVKDAQGSSKELADTMGTTYAEAMEDLGGSIKRFNETAGTPLLGFLSKAIGYVTKGVDWISKFSKEHTTLTSAAMWTVKGFALLFGALSFVLTGVAALLGVKGFIALIPVVRATGAQVIKWLVIPLMKASFWMLKFVALPALIVVGLAALGLAIVAVYKNWDTLVEYFKDTSWTQMFKDALDMIKSPLDSLMYAINFYKKMLGFGGSTAGTGSPIPSGGPVPTGAPLGAVNKNMTQVGGAVDIRISGPGEVANMSSQNPDVPLNVFTGAAMQGAF